MLTCSCFRRFSELQGRVKSAGQVTAAGTWLLNVGNHTLNVAIFFKNCRLELKIFQVFLFINQLTKIYRKRYRKVIDMKIKTPECNWSSRKKEKSITDSWCLYTSLSAMCTNQLSKSRDPSYIFIYICHTLLEHTHTDTHTQKNIKQSQVKASAAGSSSQSTNIIRLHTLVVAITQQQGQ